MTANTSKIRSLILTTTALGALLLLASTSATEPSKLSRLRATFTLNGKPHPVNLTISDGINVKTFTSVATIDHDVPRNGTYVLEWSVLSQQASGVAKPETTRDVIHQLALPEGGATLRFYLQHPAEQKLLTPVILVEQEGANARLGSQSGPRLGRPTHVGGGAEGYPGSLRYPRHHRLDQAASWPLTWVSGRHLRVRRQHRGISPQLRPEETGPLGNGPNYCRSG
jgi:hypothetical protein